MHIAMLVAAGLVGLAAFYFGANLMGRTREQGAARFIWIWLAASILNAAVGVMQAGIPVVNEIGAFIPIFGIPAGIAWYLAYRHGR
jgi:membrane associated rhomboid family serine protease